MTEVALGPDSHPAGEPDPLPQIFARLDSSSRMALAHADGMRRRAGEASIHMEHLLIGLSQANPDALGTALGERAGITDFESIIRTAVKSSIPKPGDYKIVSLTRMPPLSAHSALALIASNAAAGTEPSTPIESRHMLIGALTVTDCDPIKALIERGIATVAPPEPAPRKPRRTSVQLLGDRPAEQDELARRSYAESLARRIRRIVATGANRDNAYLMNLNGQWGSGKTTLLKLMKRELEREGDKDWLVVEFNAWEHQHLSPPWWWMTLRVWEAAWHGVRPRLQGADRSPRGSARWIVSFLRWRLGRLAQWRWMPLLFSLSAGVLVVFGLGTLIGLALQAGGPANVASMDNALKLIASLVSLGIGVVAVTRQLQDRLLFGSSAGAEMYASATARSTARLTSRYRELVALAGKNVVVFIDDLDRCQPTFAVDLLEGIQTLFVDISAVYVVAADRAWIEACFADRYAAFKDAPRERGRSLGALFIEKTFQLTAPVPVLSSTARSEFWAAILRGSTGGTGNQAIADASKEARDAMANVSSDGELRHVLAQVESDDPLRRLAYRTMAIERLAEEDIEEASEHALILFAHLLEPNPRAMKRFVNTYAVERDVQLLAADTIEDDPTASGRLALWTILQMRWPELIDELRFDIKLVDALVKGRKPRSSDALVAPLFTDVEVRRVITGEGVGASLDQSSIETLMGPMRRARPSRTATA